MMKSISRTAKSTTFDRKAQALAFILASVEANGYAPTLREIAMGMGVSLARVAQLMNALADEGVVERRANCSRAYTVNRTTAAMYLDSLPTTGAHS